MGVHPAYWIDVRKHDPLLEIKNIDRPVLILQGGRDYQVTADGDFARWKSAIKDADKDSLCEFKLYPNLNHLFVSGEGKSTPQDYEKPGHVDEQVIADLCEWINRQCAESKR